MRAKEEGEKRNDSWEEQDRRVGTEDGEAAGTRVKWWSEECDKEAFEGSSQMLRLLSSAPLEPLRYLNLACLSSTSL